MEACCFNSCSSWKLVIRKFCLDIISLWTLNTVTYSCDTSILLPTLLLTKGEQISESRFCVITSIFNNILRQISKHVHRYYSILG